MHPDIFTSSAAAVITPRRTVLIGWGKHTTFRQPPVNEKPTFFFPDFFLKTDQPWIQFDQYTEIPLNDCFLPSSSVAFPWNLPKEQNFTETVKDIVDHINDGIFDKAIAYSAAKATEEVTPLIKKNIFGNFLKNAMVFGSYPYAYWSENEGIIGSTPEELFAYSDNKLTTVACAGTAETDEFPPGEKLLLEHNTVLNALVEGLSSISIPIAQNSRWKKFGHQLYHWITPIQAILRQPPSFDYLVQTLHPSPAIGAYPKDKGMDWLKSYDQKQPRYRYGAPVGYQWIQKNEGACYPAIRNVQWQNNQWLAYAGCGIVKGSIPEQEWKEWCTKFASIRSAAGI